MEVGVGDGGDWGGITAVADSLISGAGEGSIAVGRVDQSVGVDGKVGSDGKIVLDISIGSGVGCRAVAPIDEVIASRWDCGDGGAVTA